MKMEILKTWIEHEIEELESHNLNEYTSGMVDAYTNVFHAINGTFKATVITAEPVHGGHAKKN